MDFQSNRFYHIISYGCQANMSDSEHYAGQLEELGYHHTEDLDTADVILINTCCVRETAEDKTLGKIGELKHLKTQNPDLIIAVTGCMAQEWQDKLFKRAPHIDLVIGTHNIHKLIELIQERRSKADHYMAADMSLPAFHDLPVKRFQKFFAWIPIMNGCNKFCTYCIVPYVRGREVSRPIDAIVEEIKKVAAEGYKEINYEGYGPHGVAIFIETATDNNMRTVANIRSYFTKHGGTLGTQGCLQFLFDRKACFTVSPKEGVDLDELELELIEFGVEELGTDEDGNIIIYADFNQYSQMQKYLEDNGFEIQSCEFVRIPNDTKTLTDEEKESVQKLIDKIEEDEDVQNVFTNLAD